MEHTIKRRTILSGVGAAAFSLGARRALAAPADSEKIPGFTPEVFGRLATPRPLPTAFIQDEQGRDIPLSHWLGAPFILHFWATWCPPCIAELPGVDAVARAFGASSPVIVPVAVRGSTAVKVRGFYGKHGITSLPVYVDPVSALLIETADQDALTQASKQSDPDWSKHPVSRQGIPRTIVVDASGRIVAENLGEMRWDPDSVRRTVAQLTRS
ncbi:TlpA disulfide reductase family protein [Brytella acorum]|uniref:TlpA disulfide reductase family protein n=1 Tax=Brytella acorum TaxID=2959299 RepID=A0AA35VDK0_9PROT|nr:TlpA disulfide reductase family protein [Brytella acorum]MDF3625684.1 TlpA disulfide reductase family protein [Brytella acorum]CAI9121313.1 TlpA disulfide reductase family protein [Brytella acorum]